MTPAATPPVPGNLTVPVLSGWENLVTVVVLAVVAAVVFLVVLAAAAAGSGRAEWRAWLEARSGRGRAAGPDDPGPRLRRTRPPGSRPA